ncbi:MAG: DUF1415 domain-containing protein [Woeseiaceae bacterium]
MERTVHAEATRDWLESVVIGLNLCPFAKRELDNNRVRFAVTDSATELHLLQALESELQLLFGDETIETTLLIHPEVLGDFADYNQFLDLADGLLVQMNLEGVFQIASFHPDYQFEGTLLDDAENYTNRSPFPTLHILREKSLARAIDATPDIDQIPIRNIQTMQELGIDALKKLFGR